MRVSLVQMKPILFDKQTNLEKIRSLTREAASNKVDFLVFPELSLTGYMCKNFFWELAEPIPGPSTKVITEEIKGKNLYVIFGMAEKKNGKLFNSAAICGPEGTVNIWRKIFLPNYKSRDGIIYEEKKYFNSGEELHCFDTDFGKIGIGICYEIWYPEISRAQAVQGAWLLLNISAAPRGVPNIFRKLVELRAMENVCWFGFVNQVGRQKEVEFAGGTCMVDCEGRIKHSATMESNAKEEILHCDIAVDIVTERRKNLPILKDCKEQVNKGYLKWGNKL